MGANKRINTTTMNYQFLKPERNLLMKSLSHFENMFKIEHEVLSHGTHYRLMSIERNLAKMYFLINHSQSSRNSIKIMSKL